VIHSGISIENLTAGSENRMDLALQRFLIYEVNSAATGAAAEFILLYD